MRNVLVPTDFTTESLLLVNKTAEALAGGKFNIVLFHAFNLPDSITDLLFMGREKIYKGLVTDDFRNQCKKLKNIYFENINSICVKHMYGNNTRVFRNFADANNIDLIVLPENLRLLKPHKYSVNMSSILKKSGLPIMSSFEIVPGKVTVLSRERALSSQVTAM